MGRCLLGAGAPPPVSLSGDTVATDEVLAQIETDKVTLDVRAPAAGVVQAIKVGLDTDILLP
eukprot:1177897-Prorocentrum_minimum.AAC.6